MRPVVRRLLALLFAWGCLAPFTPAHAQNPDPNTLSVQYAQELYVAMQKYLSKHGIYPPVANPDVFRAALIPYVTHQEAFISPVTGKPFLPNPALTRKPGPPGDLSTLLTLSETAPVSGQSLALYYDGHIERGGVAQYTTDRVTASAADLRLLVAAIQDYLLAQQSNGHPTLLPPMHTSAEFKAAVLPHSQNSRIFTSADTGKPYTPNAALSDQPLSSLPDYATAAVLTDAPSADGKTTIAYLDGHVTHGGVTVADPAVSGYDAGVKVTAAIRMYLQDWDDTLPPVATQRDFQQALNPSEASSRYGSSVFGYFPTSDMARLLTNPASGQPFVFNLALSGKKLASFADPASVVVFRDTTSLDSANWVVGYLDGHTTQNGVVPPDGIAATADINLAIISEAIGGYWYFNYQNDNERHLPPMHTLDELKAALGDGRGHFNTTWVYGRTTDLYTDPETHLPYRVNAMMSGVAVKHLPGNAIPTGLAASKALIFEPRRHKDGSIGYAGMGLFGSSSRFYDLPVDYRHLANLLWQNTVGGITADWLIEGASVSATLQPASGAGSPWQLLGKDDFNGDNYPDLLWYNPTSGDVGIDVLLELPDGHTTHQLVATGIPANYRLVGTGDFDGDGHPDLLWQDANSDTLFVWYMDGTTIARSASFASGLPASRFEIVTVADFNVDDSPDLLWRDKTDGTLFVWTMNGLNVTASQTIAGTTGIPSRYQITGATLLNDDGYPDLLWRDTQTGDVIAWFLRENLTPVFATVIAPGVPLHWRLAGTR